VSDRNVEIVRGVYDGWSRGDFSVGAEDFDPDVVFVLAPEFPEPGTYEGLESLVGYVRGLLVPWSEFTIAAEELVEDGDRVIAAVLQSGVGRESGSATEFRYFQIWTLRDEKVVRLENVRTREETR